MKHKKTKKTFILLELFLAFALVSCCILPFLRYPFTHVRKELDCLFKMELDRVARNRLSEWFAQLYAHEIDQKLVLTGEKETALQTKLVHIALQSGVSRDYVEKVYLYETREKIDANLKATSLMTLRIDYCNPKKPKDPVFSANIDLILEHKRGP